MKFYVVIPARFASTRLPEKMLADIAGKPMLQHTYEHAAQSGAAKVIVATDNETIKQAAEGFGAEVCMTAVTHQSGTERIAEVVNILNLPDDAIVVNLQGDEPFMPPENIYQVAMDLFNSQEATVSTLCEKLLDIEQIFNPSVVKVILDKHNYAMYFSRAPIAWDRQHFTAESKKLVDPIVHYKHLGIYAYHAGFLRAYKQLSPSYLEQVESLEQLRVLWNGKRIHLDIAKLPGGFGVDTAEDLALARKIAAAQ